MIFISMYYEIFVPTSMNFYWAVENMVLRLGYMRRRIDREQIHVPKWLVINTYTNKAVFTSKGPPDANKFIVIASSVQDVWSILKNVEPVESYNQNNDFVIVYFFGTIAQEFGVITQTFGEL